MIVCVFLQYALGIRGTQGMQERALIAAILMTQTESVSDTVVYA